MLKNKGVTICYVTLHVGLGTFRPMSVENVQDHHMHTEWFKMTKEVADRLNKAKEEKNNYHDKFISKDIFMWESQNDTTINNTKGKKLLKTQKISVVLTALILLNTTPKLLIGTFRLTHSLSRFIISARFNIQAPQ